MHVQWMIIAAMLPMGCAQPDLPLGSAKMTIGNDPAQDGDGQIVIAAAWAEDGYLYADQSNGDGAVLIYFSTNTTNPPPTCSDRSLLTTTTSPAELTIQTSRQGTPELALGDVPFVDELDLPDPSAGTTASFDNVYPMLSAGNVMITAVDQDHISGTFDGTGDDGVESNHIFGSFDVPICWND